MTYRSLKATVIDDDAKTPAPMKATWCNNQGGAMTQGESDIYALIATPTT